ncbi:MAG TPA: ATP-binding protein [Terriglobales bacterium]|nr:ATP-binding protein [Terriglobales bacterium]
MWSALRNAVSRGVEALLRWLTASVIRSTAIFVILTFVPILLLTYYIVATSIRNSQADAASADRQVRDFAVSLLRTNFRSEREALAGAADETALQRLLAESLPPAPGPRLGAYALRRQRLALARDQAQAAAALQRLSRRRPEFLALALYDDQGNLAAAAPAALAAGLPPPLPGWFQGALAGQAATSSLLPATPTLPARLAFAVPVAFPLPRADAPATSGSGVLVGILPVAAVADWVRHISLGPDQFLYLLDRRHQLVAGPNRGPFLPAQVAQFPAAADALAGHSGSGEFVTAIQLESHTITYAPLPEEGMALLVVRPVRFGFYIYRVFYDKLAFIAVIIFLLAVATGLLLRAAFRYYQRYNREVERGRAKTEALLGSIGDGIFAVDGEGRIIEFNRAAAALTGESAADALGRPYAEIIALAEESPGQLPADARPDPVRQAMVQGRAFRFLRGLTLLRRDGARLPVTFSAAPVRDQHGGVAGCIVVFSDASQEREVDRMKNEFISIASHQLRTPMSGVKGALALLLEQVLGPLNPEQLQYLRRAYDSNERLIALVNDLLNISRLEQGSLQLRAEPVPLAEVLRGLVAEYQPRAARYRQLLHLDPGDGDSTILGDPVRLREVFANLLDNAIKYTPEGGAIALRWRALPAELLVEVSDSGVGIPADKLASLFQKFTRIQNPLSGREFGTGLGLYFARSVVELHQGAIDVSSPPGQGTTFRVRLPRRPAPLAEAASPAPVLP